ncbi:MAG: DUF354 domain-containing protein [Dehalococcoidales bacterium]|nr:DUF354 domain-containing protein [Dehalococcoidales bacterium]
MTASNNKLLFIINTPSQAHTWRHVIEGLLTNGSDVNILAREYGDTPKLLRSFGFPYTTFKPVGSKFWRLLAVVNHFQTCYRIARDIRPSLIIGFGLDAAVTATLLGKPSVAFFDDEHTVWQNRMTSLLATRIITPDTFQKTLGKNHVRMKGYKELAYLHPSYFAPDPTIYDELKIERGEPYVILRFNLLDAIHDIGRHGLSVSSQIDLVKKFEKHAHVFVSPEGSLPKELERYRLQIPYDRIHHALYYANLLVSNSCTMTTEAAILGTPAVRIHPIVGRNVDPMIFSELEQRYGLIYSYRNTRDAVQKAIELISRPTLKEEWTKKRKKLLADKIDVANILLRFIEHSLDTGTEKMQLEQVK